MTTQQSKRYPASLRPILLGLLFAGAAAGPASPAALAQDTPLLETGAGYNYVHTNAPPGGCGCFSLNGGSGWVAYNFTSAFAAVGEIGVQHASNINNTGTDLTLTSYLFGPRLASANTRA